MRIANRHASAEGLWAIGSDVSRRGIVRWLARSTAVVGLATFAFGYLFGGSAIWLYALPAWTLMILGVLLNRVAGPSNEVHTPTKSIDGDPT